MNSKIFYSNPNNLETVARSDLQHNNIFHMRNVKKCDFSTRQRHTGLYNKVIIFQITKKAYLYRWRHHHKSDKLTSKLILSLKNIHRYQIARKLQYFWEDLPPECMKNSYQLILNVSIVFCYALKGRLFHMRIN